MKTQFCLTFIFFFAINQLIAQDVPKAKFGKPDIEELKMKKYLPDTTAVAVILYDEGRSAVGFDASKIEFALTFERFVRIKILKQAGTEWGTFKIPIYSSVTSKEEIVGVNGITFNLEGEKTIKSEMKKDAIFQERENKYWEIVRLTLPSVKVGSVIDLRFTIHSPLLWNLQPWAFQYLIPVKWSQYEVNYPEYFIYNHSSLGYYPLSSQTQTTRNETLSYTTTSELTTANWGTGNSRVKENYSIPYTSNIYNSTLPD
jgi:hypothetical protein